MQKPEAISSAVNLFEEATSLNLFKNLVVQIEKDFNLASVDLEIDTIESTTPNSLLDGIESKIYYLLQYDTSTYINLLYIIDVPEHSIKYLKAENLEQFSKDISFLILKRCWMKVWYKANY
ncbi:hypothetical protein [Croceibacter atlanticus]|uniref:hypothetical protein n=1 Tax=Croceibacter atlanticus TaxID=313588 RepID=UPI002E148AFE|nr:hypothetical protein VVL01_03620 [Croceibacter atlanticus]|tara:strand:+ start:6777 stop:7139 length:363 start_codon:yes stop_codon:yes gene_type:complete